MFKDIDPKRLPFWRDCNIDFLDGSQKCDKRKNGSVSGISFLDQNKLIPRFCLVSTNCCCSCSPTSKHNEDRTSFAGKPFKMEIEGKLKFRHE